MKTVVLLSLLVCAACAAPAEDKQEAPDAAAAGAPEAPEAPEEQAAAPAHVFEEEAAPEARFNFCPDGWFTHGSRCFLFVNNPMSWYNAENHCNSVGGNLASATNGREYSYLQTITQTQGQSVAWLGGFNLQNQWMWIDREPFYYTNWYSQSSVSSYPCIYLRTGTGWSNAQCSTAYRFICSKDPFRC